MNGKMRAFLLFLITLIVLGAIGFALYTLRGLDGLPLIGRKTAKPAAETPVPTEVVEPEVTVAPAETPVPEVTPEPAPEVVEPTVQPDEAVSSLTGQLNTESFGTLRYRSEILGPNQGEESDSVTLGHVYSNMGKIRVQFLNADGSAFQDPIEVDYAAENLYQEPRVADLNGDGSDELVLLLRTYEEERAVLLFAYNPDTAVYERVGIIQNDVITWSSGFDASSNQIWYRHGTRTIQYDCYELQGTRLVLVRRLEDNRLGSAEERFTEYAVAGDSLLKEQAGVSADAIDHVKWSFVNFN